MPIARSERVEPSTHWRGWDSLGRVAWCRFELNHPPTDVGGIPSDESRDVGSELNHPPTDVGGIPSDESRDVGSSWTIHPLTWVEFPRTSRVM